MDCLSVVCCCLYMVTPGADTVMFPGRIFASPKKNLPRANVTSKSKRHKDKHHDHHQLQTRGPGLDAKWL